MRSYGCMKRPLPGVIRDWQYPLKIVKHNKAISSVKSLFISNLW